MVSWSHQPAADSISIKVDTIHEYIREEVSCLCGRVFDAGQWCSLDGDMKNPGVVRVGSIASTVYTRVSDLSSSSLSSFTCVSQTIAILYRSQSDGISNNRWST